MNANQSSCSSEQSTSQQDHQGEMQDSFTSQKNEADTGVVVQSNSQTDENRHSIKISDSGKQTTSQECSSSVGNENSSETCGIKTVTEDGGKQCVEEDSSSSVNHHWCDPSMLLDNSVEEFSIAAEGNKSSKDVQEVYLKQSLDEMSIGKESVHESTHEKESESLTHSRENKEKAELSLVQQVEIKDEVSSPAGPENQANSNCLQNEIHSLLSAASPLCSPTSDLEVGRVDFSTTPKENLMRMVSDLLDECDWLKKEKAR